MFSDLRILAHAARLAVFSSLSILPFAGCGPSWWAEQADSSTLGLSALDDPGVDSFAESGPNDLLELAQFVPASAEPRVIRGEIRDETDVDVYDIGAGEPGDHIQVAVAAAESLSAVIALFDDTGAALLINDHRNVYLGRRGPFVDLVMRRPSSATFVAVSATPGFRGTGAYDLAVTRTPGATIPEPQPDSILLVFGGATAVRIGPRPAIDVPAFDAAAISSNYRGQTDAMIREIVSRVRVDYLGYHLNILSTSEGDTGDGQTSRVYFGTFDSALLGVAEGIDEYNATRAQKAIVFTDTFEAFMTLRPSLEEMAQAIANVASHEIGHLLGLVHTADPRGIMDVTASLSQLLVDQSFTQSRLYDQVFPLGFENEVQMLLDSVGGQEDVVFSAQTLSLPKISYERLRVLGPPARGLKPFSTCCLGHAHD